MLAALGSAETGSGYAGSGYAGFWLCRVLAMPGHHLTLLPSHQFSLDGFELMTCKKPDPAWARLFAGHRFEFIQGELATRKERGMMTRHSQNPA